MQTPALWRLTCASRHIGAIDAGLVDPSGYGRPLAGSVTTSTADPASVQLRRKDQLQRVGLLRAVIDHSRESLRAGPQGSVPVAELDDGVYSGPL